MPVPTDMDDLVRRLASAQPRGKRLIVAVVGPPASGKSTFASDLADALNNAGHTAQVVPMDGFHLGNTVLDAKGWRSRKGAPNTFDLPAFTDLVSRLADGNPLYFPLFDRENDLAIMGAGEIAEATKIVVVEGNYLLLKDEGWADLARYWDVTVSLSVPLAVLQERLLDRWESFGFTADAALKRAQENDLPNAEYVINHSQAADYEIGVE